MFGRNRRSKLQDAVDASRLYVEAVAEDDEVRGRLRSALEHAGLAASRARVRTGMTGVATRLATDRKLRENLKAAAEELDKARKSVRRRESHRGRKLLLVLLSGGGVVLVASGSARRWLMRKFDSLRGSADELSTGSAGSAGSETRIEDTIEVAVPVSTAYNQWTQFEQFPQFMEGVEEVRQLDDTLLHFAAQVAGKREEWDAKILEQEPDRHIAWQSVGGKPNSGRVTFQPLGDDRASVTLSMSYPPEGVAEKAGSAVGLDRRRVKGDLERFKDLVESEGASGSWRGEIHDGQTS